MGGRGASYFEKKNSFIENLLRMMQLQKEIKEKNKYFKQDPESLRNDYSLFKELKSAGISTRKSTDKSSLNNLKPHQEQLVYLSSKYKNLISTIQQENEVELSKFKISAHGCLSRAITPEGKIWCRIVLSSRCIDKKEEYYSLKKDAIKNKDSAKVDEDKIYLYTTTHEFGHLVEENLFWKRFKKSKSKDYLEFQKQEATNIKNDVIKICQKHFKNDNLSVDDIYISNYGKDMYKDKKEDFEWFAETFTNLELSKNPEPISKALGEYLRRNNYE